MILENVTHQHGLTHRAITQPIGPLTKIKTVDGEMSGEEYCKRLAAIIQRRQPGRRLKLVWMRRNTCYLWGEDWEVWAERVGRMPR